MGELVFWTCAGVAIASALMVVTRRNPMYAAFYLVVAFLALAASLVPLDATFLAVMHLLVYTGAIMVLFLFIIMLLNLGTVEGDHEYPFRFRLFAALLSAAIFALFAYAFGRSPLGPPPSVPEEFGRVEGVGSHLFRAFVLPFELVSALILAAIFGTVVLARRKERIES
jgi:NADH-quinone oxidoreductase subunit J